MPKLSALFPLDPGYQRIWALALPTLVYNFLEMSLGMADLIMVRSLGQEATAAMGLNRQITFLVEAAALAVSAGVVTLISQGIGRGDKQQVDDTVRQSLLLITAISIAFTISGLVLSRPLLVLLRATPDTIAHALPYLNIYFITVLFLGVNAVAAAVFRGAKKPGTPLRIALFMAALNIPLNYIFIHGGGPIPAYGVGGAAIGTAIARAIAMTISIALLVLGATHVRLRFSSFAQIGDWGIVPKIMRVGLPLAIAGLYRNGARVLYMGVVGLSVLGASFHAAVGIGLQVRLLSVLPALAFQIATATLVAEAIGKDRPQDVPLIARQSWLLLAALMTVMTVLVVIFARPIAALFTLDADTIELTVTVLRWFAAGQFFSALAIGVQGALSGAGDTRPIMRYTILTQWGILLAGAYVLLKLGFDPLGPLIAWTIAPIVILTLLARRWRAGHWKNIRL